VWTGYGDKECIYIAGGEIFMKRAVWKIEQEAEG
jgi:hypothetical protein